MKSDPASRQSILVNGLLEAADAYSALRDLVVSERKKLEEAGFSPTAAEEMAIEIWRAALRGSAS